MKKLDILFLESIIFKIKIQRGILIMKKIFLLFFVVVMLFTLVSCANNDENNAIVQAKIDEAEVLVQQIYSWYEDNGLLEGEYEAQFKPKLDKMLADIDSIKASNQEMLDGGGYSDENTAKMLEGLDVGIAKYKEALAMVSGE